MNLRKAGFQEPGSIVNSTIPLFESVVGNGSAWPQCCGAGIIDTVSGRRMSPIQPTRKVHDSGSTYGLQAKKQYDEQLKERDLTAINAKSSLQLIREVTDFKGWFAIPEEVAIAYLLEKVVKKAEREAVDGPYYGGENFAVKIWAIIDSYYDKKKGVDVTVGGFRINNLIEFLRANTKLTTHFAYLSDMPSSYGNHFLHSLTFSPALPVMKKWVETRRRMMVEQVMLAQQYQKESFKTLPTKAVNKVTATLSKAW